MLMMSVKQQQPTTTLRKIIGKSPKSYHNFSYLPHMYQTGFLAGVKIHHTFVSETKSFLIERQYYHPLNGLPKNNRWPQHPIEAWRHLWHLPFETTLTAFLLAISHYVTKIWPPFFSFSLLKISTYVSWKLGLSHRYSRPFKQALSFSNGSQPNPNMILQFVNVVRWKFQFVV